MEPEQEFLTVAETAKVMRTTRVTVYRLLDAGQLEHVRLTGAERGAIRIARSALDAFLARRTVPVADAV